MRKTVLESGMGIGADLRKGLDYRKAYPASDFANGCNGDASDGR